MEVFLKMLSGSHSGLLNLLRISIFIVTVWIGGLKIFQYEADGIVPFVANSPVLSFFYSDPGHYKEHVNKEGQVVEENIQYHKRNGTYVFAYFLGTVIILIGVLTLSGIWVPFMGIAGGLLTAIMSLVTLSFLITTPEAYVPALGGPQHGFPFLSGAGRLVVKDVIMLAAGMLVASGNARQLLIRRHKKSGVRKVSLDVPWS